MSAFRINYNQVIKQANQIKTLSEDLDREIRKLNDILNSTKSDWKGPASTTFQNHLSLLIDDMKNTKKSMANVSSTIKYIAREIREEDEREAELARELAD